MAETTQVRLPTELLWVVRCQVEREGVSSIFKLVGQGVSC